MAVSCCCFNVLFSYECSGPGEILGTEHISVDTCEMEWSGMEGGAMDRSRAPAGNDIALVTVSWPSTKILLLLERPLLEEKRQWNCKCHR